MSGIIGTEVAKEHGVINGAKNNDEMHQEFLEVTKSLNLKGNEFFADPKWYKLGLINPEKLVF